MQKVIVALLVLISGIHGIPLATAPKNAPVSAPSDPLLYKEWGWFKVEADAAWVYNYTGRNITIAVLDTGADLDHPDLKGIWWKNPGETPDNGIDDDGNGYVDDVYGWNFVANNNNVTDDNGHGTMVIGVIAAQPNNIGIVGVAPGVKIMVLKVLDANGSGTTTYIKDAINYARDNGADIISMSLGGEKGFLPDVALNLAISNANSSGILMIAAAGNDGKYGINYPASQDEVIAVTATVANDTLANYSNYGPEAELSAPGGAETGNVDDYIISTAIGGKYAYAIGTSMAVPFVSGLAALAMERYPNMTGAEIRQLLANTSDDLGIPGRDEEYGYGRVNACRLLGLPEADPFPIPTGPTTPSPQDILQWLRDLLFNPDTLFVLSLVAVLLVLVAILRHRRKEEEYESTWSDDWSSEGVMIGKMSG